MPRRAILTVLIFCGLRRSELCALRWRHVDLANGWLSIGEAKTDAGVRRVKLRPIVREELASIRPIDADPDAFVFATRTGKPASPTNLGARVLMPAVERANASLSARGLPPLPAKLTPHSLRRTFASVLYALGEDPGVAMDELGHTDPGLALRVYRQAMRRGVSEKAQLRSLVEGVWAGDWADEPVDASKSPQT